LRISYKKASTFVGEYRRNLQRGGTFIKTRKPLDVGRDCVLHLTVPGFDDAIEIQGTVVWSSKGQTIGPGQDEGMGIRYDPTDERGMESLKSAVERLS
jgi:type IV pilus assembly protein PilZ